MSSWSSRRKFVYSWSVILILTAVSFGIFWKFWYAAPTCYDRLQNGDETGVDCGGSCALVCSMQAQPPILRSDPRVFKVMDNIYSVLSFVENHNVNFEAPYVPYKFKIYDDKNKLLGEREGFTVLARNRTSAIFEGSILIARGIPKRAEIELPKNISWVKSAGEEPEIEIKNSPLLREDISPRIEASIANNSIKDLQSIELVAVVFDGKDNAIAASRTFINRLDKNAEANVFFTWPKPFDLGSKVCSNPSQVVIAIDRSSSMSSLGKSPPEPLTSVKSAAASFISELKEADSAGLLSFATEASNPPDSFLSNDFAALKLSIEDIKIKEDGTQYTNIADAISKSVDLLSLSEGISNDRKIIVLLTDGVATKPSDPKGAKSEAEEIAYAEATALEKAGLAKQNNIIVYTIGLGKDVHHDFLRRIASSRDNYFEAPSTTTLNSIYKNISSSICKELPSRIEITYKILEAMN